jgi:hypothetical protein
LWIFVQNLELASSTLTIHLPVRHSHQTSQG